MTDTTDTEAHVISPEARYYKIKALIKDADALLLYALVAIYLAIPEDWKNRILDRLDDPLAIALISVAGGGRFLVRGLSAYGSAKVEAAIQTSDAATVPAGVRRPRAPRDL